MRIAKLPKLAVSLTLAVALLGLSPLFATPGYAQEEEAPAGAEPEDNSEENDEATDGASKEEEDSDLSLISALADLRAALASKDGEIEAQQAALKDAPDATTREAFEAELESLHEDRGELSARFARLTSKTDDSLFVEAPPEPFDPRDRVFGLLKPVFDELEDMTSNSRKISQLEEDLAVQRARLVEASKAVKNISALSAKELDADLRAAVEEQLDIWDVRATAANAQLSSIKYELSERRSQQQPMLDTVSSFVRGFVRTRGFNLLLAVAAFCIAFFGVRGLQAIVTRVRPTPKKKRLSDRMIALAMHGLSLLLGVASVLFVFNATGDWFLLGISLFFLAGMAWVLVKALPQYVEQIRLVLNMGTVKEDELLVFDGIAWRVQSIGFQAKLVNDRLRGGLQVLPARDLVGLHSRPFGENEGLFPCSEGDWVSLEDGTIGRVNCPTPRVVQLVLLGGGRKGYATSAFLAQNPQNLSANYRVEFTFGIDYKHQQDCTQKIPAAMQAKLEAGLPEVLEEGELLNVEVEFKEAAASSLDYEIQIDVDGDAASKYEDVERAAARFLVDACNEHGWEIPFQQLTVHQAAVQP